MPADANETHANKLLANEMLENEIPVNEMHRTKYFATPPMASIPDIAWHLARLEQYSEFIRKILQQLL